MLDHAVAAEFGTNDFAAWAVTSTYTLIDSDTTKSRTTIWCITFTGWTNTNCQGATSQPS
jgi:hypothetical protein